MEDLLRMYVKEQRGKWEDYFNFTWYTKIIKWLASCEITWLSEHRDAIWKNKLEGWNHLIPRFNEIGYSIMHADAIKFFESEHRILSHSPDSSSWTSHLAAQCPIMVCSHWDRYPHPWFDYSRELWHNLSPESPTVHWIIDNPWNGKFCSCPSVENLSRLTQFHYWRAGNETNFFLHGKIPCGVL